MRGEHQPRLGAQRLRQARRRLGDRSLKVCATTGVAALNLRDKLQAMFGQHVDTSTLYRWSGIGLGPREGQSFADYMSYMRTRGRSYQGACARIRGTKTLIIDEVSMMPGRILGMEVRPRKYK